MLPKILTQIFGSRNDRLLKQYRRSRSQRINALEPTFEKLDDDAAARQDRRSSATAWPTARALDELLPEAFAVVREGRQARA